MGLRFGPASLPNRRGEDHNPMSEASGSRGAHEAENEYKPPGSLLILGAGAHHSPCVNGCPPSGFHLQSRECRCLPRFLFPLAVSLPVPDSFNPYHEWLGLGEQVVDPNHYELLALEG